MDGKARPYQYSRRINTVPARKKVWPSYQNHYPDQAAPLGLGGFLELDSTEMPRRWRSGKAANVANMHTGGEPR